MDGDVRDLSCQARAVAGGLEVLTQFVTAAQRGGPERVERVSTEEVARLAGVGIATVFRHFPTKAILLTAVLARRFDRLRARAEELSEAVHPGPAFFDFFAEVVADAATKIAIGEALLDAGGDDDGDDGADDGADDDGDDGDDGDDDGDDDGEAEQAANGLRRAIGALLRRAQEAGAVRSDVELPEVYALLVGTSRAAANPHVDDEVKDRMLAVVFDGLAPGIR